MKAYKVLRVDKTSKKGIRYRSCSCCDPNYIVEYSYGKRIYPKVKGSYILVFDDITNAISFNDFLCYVGKWKIVNNFQIFECKTSKLISLPYLARTNSFELFWETCNQNRLNKKEITYGIDYTSFATISPDGTLGARWVELIKRVA